MPIKNLNHHIKESNTPHTDLIEKISYYIGTKQFIRGLTGFFILWMVGNIILHFAVHLDIDFWPYLALSTFINVWSAYTAPIVTISSNAQQEREKLRADLEYELAIKSEKENLEIFKAVNEIKELLKNGA